MRYQTGAAALETDAWVRELVAAAPGCLFVCLGRERLGWDRRFPADWAGHLDDQHLLGGLAEPDAQRYLETIPIPDAAVRRAIIHRVTQLSRHPDQAPEHPAVAGLRWDACTKPFPSAALPAASDGSAFPCLHRGQVLNLDGGLASIR